MGPIYKRIFRAVSKAIIFTLIFWFIFIYIISFPISHPDKTLDWGHEITAFIERLTLPLKLARLSWLPTDKEVLMPVHGIRVREINDSWHDPRPDNREHEGQDIFADRGTPVFSATNGYVIRISVGELGGNSVYIAGAGGRRYYYAHFDRVANGLHRGQEVTTDTVIGFVGNTGNAENTPPHLHFGIYVNRKAINPLPLLTNRATTYSNY